MTKGTAGTAETDSEYEHGADRSNNKFLHHSFEGMKFLFVYKHVRREFN
jgi:hypothetical protein